MGKKKGQQKKSNNFIEEADKKNDLLKEYYIKILNLSEEEWKLFNEAFTSELPVTFRVTGFRDQSKEIDWLLQNKLIETMIDSENNKKVPVRIPWYPNNLAWQLNASKMEIRRTPELKVLHKFLISETNCGFISRQEAVSMIPPLLLDIKSHHKVLDLCAAPGSKTAQLIEMLHSCDGTPSGVVMANDINAKRCYMMVHQLKRLQSPCTIVVRQDASNFPKFYVPDQSNKYGRSPMQFDRILADVPCSGDGTLRKNPTIWPRWSPYLAVNEHYLQIKILRRSLEMLAVGGRMVYSTCSLSPSEDESVVATVLDQCKGSAKLIDIGSILPELMARPGLTNWSVMLKDKTWCPTFESLPQEQKRSLRPTLFPPPNVADLNLEYCRRVLPHQQNTGGFFLALIEKVACLPWMNANKVPGENKESNGEIVDDTIIKAEEKVNTPELNVKIDDDKEVKKDDSLFQGPAAKKQRIFKEDPFYYFKEDDEDFVRIRDYYRLDSSFPSSQLMYRNADSKRRFFYFTNDLVKQIVRANEDREGVNFVNLGVKMFHLSEDKMFNGYRLLQDGIEIAESFIGDKRRLFIKDRNDLLTLLNYDYPLIDKFSEDLNDQFNKSSLGPVVFEYVPQQTTDFEGNVLFPRIPLHFTGWRGNLSIRSYVDKDERCHILRLCGEEPSEILEAARRVVDNGDNNDVVEVTEEMN